VPLGSEENKNEQGPMAYTTLTGICGYCGKRHLNMVCARVKVITNYPDGTHVVEFHPGWGNNYPGIVDQILALTIGKRRQLLEE
jgi:hypothetical protein